MSDKMDELEVRVRDLERTLRQGDLELAVIFELSESLGNLLGLLLSVPAVSEDMIENRLSISSDARIAIHRLRHRLKPYHERLDLPPNSQAIIKTHHGVGWSIPYEIKDKIITYVKDKGCDIGHGR